jgi:hypothetical protein
MPLPVKDCPRRICQMRADLLLLAFAVDQQLRSPRLSRLRGLLRDNLPRCRDEKDREPPALHRHRALQAMLGMPVQAGRGEWTQSSISLIR